MDLDIEKLALLKAMGGSGSGGGGSGAVVRTYTGTLETIFSANSIDIQAVTMSVARNEATMRLVFDSSFYEYCAEDMGFSYCLYKKSGAFDNGFMVLYNDDGTFKRAFNEDGAIDSSSPCTLIIIDHPLSSSITAEALSVTANSEYDAPLGKLYNHVSVEVPQQGATVAVFGPFDVGDALGATAINTFRSASSGHSKATCLVKAADYYYRVYADFDTTPFEGTVVCWYMDRTNNLLIKHNIVYSDQKVTVNELGSPFEVIRIAGIQA